MELLDTSEAASLYFQGGFGRCLGDSFSTSQAHDDWVVCSQGDFRDSSESSVLQKEGAGPDIAEGRGCSITLTEEGAVRYAVKRRSSSPSSRRKEQPFIFQTEGAVLLRCRRKEQWPRLELRLVMHFAYMERAIHSTSHMLALSLVMVTDFTMKSAKVTRSQQDRLCQGHRELLIK